MNQLVEQGRFPFPYKGAFALASDIDSANVNRFRAVHALFSGTDVIRPDSMSWRTLGLTTQSRWYDPAQNGVCGLGLEIADSFFLIGDATTFGIYRHEPEKKRFVEDQDEGENCAGLIHHWLNCGYIDSFHAFLHYTRAQVEPLLLKFYRSCEESGTQKPFVWANHSAGVTPSGICPDKLQVGRMRRFAGLTARSIVGPLFGRRKHPLSQAFVRYRGATPGSPYYINDLLKVNGLKFVWLNSGDLLRNRVALPLKEIRGRRSILDVVQMDDGIRYYRFDRCYGWPETARAEGMYLRDSEHGHDTSSLITENNLRDLCETAGTCVLTSHWTHRHSFPISDETIGRFMLLKKWHDSGKLWVAATSRLLEWTRMCTFLDYSCSENSDTLLIDINGVDDPLFGKQRLSAQTLHGLCFKVNRPKVWVRCAVNGDLLPDSELRREGEWIWLNTAQTGANPAERDAVRSNAE